MAKLRITLACWDYDRVAALASGQVPVDGVDLVMLTSPPEETFFRMVRHREFEASEMSLSSYVVTLMQDDPPFIAIPVFPSRVFRHGSIFVSAKSGIEKPSDIIGKRVAAPEYQMTAPVWIRGMLSDDFGVTAENVVHFTGGVEQPGREEKLKLDLPARIRISSIGPDRTITQMLAEGELDAFFTARAPSTFYSRPNDVRRLFPDFVKVEQDYFRRTKIFPIMHTVVIRRDVYRANPWIAQSLTKAFAEAKRRTFDNLAQTAAFKVMLPWLSSHVEEARRELGEDWWPYGFAANRAQLDTFLRYHHEQGLSHKRLTPEQLFAPESLESFLV
jgi:4,5-dihydroxyphthalate decarboxylase